MNLFKRIIDDIKKSKARTAMAIAIGLVTFVFFAVVFIQVKTVSIIDISAIETMRESELREELSSWKSKYDEVSSRLNETDEIIEAYKKELEARLQEKRQIQEECDALAIKARRYDELQESVVKIKMNAELRAHSVVDEAQEKAMDTVMLIDDIEKEIRLFGEDIIHLRRDIKTGTLTLDDRLDNVYLRLCKSLDKLTAIRREFYIRNSLPMDQIPDAVAPGAVPVMRYPMLLNPPAKSVPIEETADPETVREIEQEKAQKADTPSKKDIRKNTAPSDGI